MSVQSEIDRIITAVGNAYSKVSEKGGTVPASQTVANLATAIDSIPAGGGAPSLQSKSVTYTSNGTNTITPDDGYDGLSSVDVTVDVSGGGGETAENVVITSSLPSNLNEYIKICGIDKNGNKILLNGYTTPVSVKKNTPLMILISEYPYARISGQYTVLGAYSVGANAIIDTIYIGSGDNRVPLIVPTGDLNIYDTDSMR